MPTGGTYQFRNLQTKLSTVLQQRLRMLPFYGGNLIPTSTSLKPGTREIVQDEVLGYGEATLMAQDADDIPLVEINARENTYRVVMPVVGYSVSYSDELSDEVARGNGIQYNPRDSKMQAATRVIEERCNKVAAVGSTAHNFTGMLNNAGVTPINSSFDPFNAASTPDDIADWFLSLVGEIFKASNNVEFPNTALVSTALHELMARRRMPDSSDTVLSYIVNTQRARSALLPGQRLEDIVPLVECGATYLEANGVEAAATNKDRIVLYPRDQEVVQKHVMSGAMAMFPENWAINKGARRIFPIYSFMSQVIINFPGAFSYIKHNKEV